MKQETLEEVAEREASLFYEKGSLDWNKYRQVFIEGAKWQQERMFSEEIIDILDNVRYWETCPDKYKIIIEEWFEQFKKK